MKSGEKETGGLACEMSETTVTINMHESASSSAVGGNGSATAPPQTLTGILVGTKSNLTTITDMPVTDPGSSNKVRYLQ